MNQNKSFRLALIGILSAATAPLLQCDRAPDVLPPPNQGGATGQGGAPPDDNSGGSGGGGSGGDNGDAGVHRNLDVTPLWWGTADAPQGPETAEPSIDVNCGFSASKTERKPADILLLLDGSSSLSWSITDDQTCRDPTTCTARLDAIKPAVNATVSSSQNINWGLKIFPTPGGARNITCNVSTGVEVPVAADSATAIQQQVDSMTTATLQSSTPTRKALENATAYLQSLTDTNDKFILLATDGEPNCRDDNSRNDDLDGAVAAAKAANDAGFKVYVIGIGPNLDNLTQIAEAGGTTDYYPVSSPEQLVEVLSSISKFVGSCTFTADTEPPDPENVAVYVNKQLVDKSADDGWTYGNSTQEIKLTGSYCELIMAGEETSVQILFGCPGVSFPSFVP